MGLKKSVVAVGSLVLFGSALYVSEIQLLSFYKTIDKTVYKHVDSQLASVDETINAEIIFLGDSTARRSIDSNLIYRLTGKKSISLGTNRRIGSFADIRLLEEYLKNNTPPERIYVIRSNNSWGKSLDFNHYLEFSPGIRASYTLFQKHIFSFEELLQASLSNQFTFMQVSNPIRREISKNWTNKSNMKTAKKRSFIKSDKRHISSEQLSLLHYLCKLASKHSIPVQVLLSPQPTAPSQDKKTIRSAKNNLKFLDTSLQQFENCSVLHNIVFYEKKFFRDKEHLNAKGKQKYSEWFVSTYLQ